MIFVSCTGILNSICAFRMTPRLQTMGNSPNVLNWEWDSGYKGTSIEDEYPLRVEQSGPDTGLEITFVAHEQDRTSLCTANDEEFIVVLSAPGDSMNSQFDDEFDVDVPISTNSLLSMEPELTTTSNELRSYSPNERGCFYNDERRLAFNKIYTEQNCEMECIANVTIRQLKCAAFYHPRK